MFPALNDIEAHITPERLNQGRQLFTDGRVTAPTIQRGGELITAVIPRAGSRPLRVYVRTIDNGNRVTIAGECSWPKKKNCEHVAAVLLQALADGLYQSGGNHEALWSEQDLEMLFEPLDA